MNTFPNRSAARRRSAGLFVGALLVLAACGSGDGAAEPASESLPASAETGPAATAVPLGPVVLETSAVKVEGQALAPLEDPANDPAVGLDAPVVSGQRFDGTDISVGGPSEQPTMLVFLAHWCPHCNDEIPEILKLRDAGDLPDGFDIVGVSTAVVDDRDNYPPSKWMVDKAWPWPVLADSVDSEAIQAYGGSGFPFTVMLDAGGTVLARRSGAATADEIRDWIDGALSTISTGSA